MWLEIVVAAGGAGLAMAGLGVAGVLATQVIAGAASGQLVSRLYPAALYGNPRRVIPSPLLFLEWEDAASVAMILATLDDETAAGVLGKLKPRYARKVYGHLPAGARKDLDFWLNHPQPFPRSRQLMVARRFKKALEHARGR